MQTPARRKETRRKTRTSPVSPETMKHLREWNKFKIIPRAVELLRKKHRGTGRIPPDTDFDDALKTAFKESIPNHHELPNDVDNAKYASQKHNWINLLRTEYAGALHMQRRRKELEMQRRRNENQERHTRLRKQSSWVIERQVFPQRGVPKRARTVIRKFGVGKPKLKVQPRLMF